MRIFSRVALGVVVLLLVLVCAGLGWFNWARHAVAARMATPDLMLKARPSAELQFETLDGKHLRLSELKGKVVFLDLWGTWCVQCVAEMPTVQKLYDRYRDDRAVQFLIVSRMDTPAQIRAYASRNGFTRPFYRMRDEDIPATMQLGQFPSTFLYAKSGALMMEHSGAADWSAAAVTRAIERLKDE